MKIRKVVLVVLLGIVGTFLCLALLGGEPSRVTDDVECTWWLAEALVVSGIDPIWDDFTRTEKHTFVTGISGGSGTVGKYLRDCVDEGWKGYLE